jgi:hypothetical protein
LKRILSYSLWGNDPRYLVGALRNIDGQRRFYPGWTCRFYVDEETMDRHSMLMFTLENAGAEVVPMIPGVPKMMQRFLVADDPEVERFCVRDCDSRLSEREAQAVEAWIGSDLILHIMRDHPAHQVMPGGMWGATWRRSNWEAPRMRQLIYGWMNNAKADVNTYQRDQDFLAHCVFPWAQHSCLAHDSSRRRRSEIGGQPFPTPRTNWPRFVGEVFLIGTDGEDVPREGDYQQVPENEE